MAGEICTNEGALTLSRMWPSAAAASAQLRPTGRSRFGRARAGRPAVLGLVPPDTLEGVVAGRRVGGSDRVSVVAQFAGQVVVTITPEGRDDEATTITIPLGAVGYRAAGSVPGQDLL